MESDNFGCELDVACHADISEQSKTRYNQATNFGIDFLKPASRKV
jgi:hypothetical protein